MMIQWEVVPQDTRKEGSWCRVPGNDKADIYLFWPHFNHYLIFLYTIAPATPLVLVAIHCSVEPLVY